ncbi:MAG TPA: OsmC family peroxiredoxin [Sediminispirochaeta sp.]|nr:OsmC family peroxiredoxin [Sediminispirochaeta sp.]
MSTEKIECSWKEGMAFETEITGHKIVMDAHESVGGKDQGPRPKPLIIASLAGCTGMDVVSILKKMQQDFSFFNISIESELTEEHPKTYSQIKVVYEFKKSDNLDEKKVEKAVQLSQERYCGVSALLKKAIPVDYEIRYL